VKKLPLFVLAVCFCAPAFSWSPRAQREIAVRAVALMPPGLREILKININSLAEGAVAPFGFNDPENHFQHANGEYGTAAAKAEQEAEKLTRLIESGADLDAVASQFGIVAHYVADVNQPLHTSDADPKEALYYAEFNKLIDGRLKEFPVVFYGYTLPLQKTLSIQEFLLRSAERANRFYFLIGDAFLRKGGKVRPASSFDMRSIPFGIASISYSHAISDVANVWLLAWKRAGKPITSTPYLETAPENSPPGRPTPRLQE
jgi:hypothetical protein